MNAFKQTPPTPLWCATAESRFRATCVVSCLWITALALFASALICPYSWALRLGEGVLGMYLWFRLMPVTRQLWASRHLASAPRPSDSSLS